MPAFHKKSRGNIMKFLLLFLIKLDGTIPDTLRLKKLNQPICFYPDGTRHDSITPWGLTNNTRSRADETGNLLLGLHNNIAYFSFSFIASFGCFFLCTNDMIILCPPQMDWIFLLLSKISFAASLYWQYLFCVGAPSVSIWMETQPADAREGVWLFQYFTDVVL